METFNIYALGQAKIGIFWWSKMNESEIWMDYMEYISVMQSQRFCGRYYVLLYERWKCHRSHQVRINFASLYLGNFLQFCSKIPDCEWEYLKTNWNVWLNGFKQVRTQYDVMCDYTKSTRPWHTIVDIEILSNDRLLTKGSGILFEIPIS